MNEPSAARRFLVGGLFATCLIAAWFGLLGLHPLPSDLLHPFVVDADLEEPEDGDGPPRIRTADIEEFSVRVAPARTATTVGYAEGTGDPVVLETSGIWLIIPVEVIAAEEPIELRGVHLTSRSGKRYALSGRFPSGYQAGTSINEPGIGMIGGWIFELPPEELEGSELFISRDLQPQLTGQVRVDLEIGPGLADEAEEYFQTNPPQPRMPQ